MKLYAIYRYSYNKYKLHFIYKNIHTIIKRHAEQIISSLIGFIFNLFDLQRNCMTVSPVRSTINITILLQTSISITIMINISTTQYIIMSEFRKLCALYLIYTYL